MADLTPLFEKCVEIVDQELKGPASRLRESQPHYFVHDTFDKECRDLYDILIQLTAFTSAVRPAYLKVHDEFSRLERTSMPELKTEDKNKIDEEFKIKIQQTYEKLKHLQSYEKKRVQLANSRSKKGGLLSLFSDLESDPEAAYNAIIAVHRNLVMRFLNDTTTTLNRVFEKMQRKRFEREQLLNLLHFQNVDDMDIDGDAWDQQFLLEDEESQPTITTTNNDLSQEQLQELKAENQELLQLKTNQYEQVEKLHSSMNDVVRLQTELTLHLETQAEQIDTLLDNQDAVDADLRMGNKSLNKATNRNKRGSNMIVSTCWFLSFLILLLDYMS